MQLIIVHVGTIQVVSSAGCVYQKHMYSGQAADDPNHLGSSNTDKVEW